MERDHPNPDIRRNMMRARDIRAAHLRGLLLWMAVRPRDWVARWLGAPIAERRGRDAGYGRKARRFG
jgi:hypothetical protein